MLVSGYLGTQIVGTHHLQNFSPKTSNSCVSCRSERFSSPKTTLKLNETSFSKGPFQKDMNHLPSIIFQVICQFSRGIDQILSNNKKEYSLPLYWFVQKRSPFHGVLYLTYQSTIFLATSVETHVTTPLCCNFPNLFCTSHLKCAHQSDEPTPSMMRLGTKSLSHSALVHTWRFAIITSSKSLCYLYRLFSSKVLVQALPEGSCLFGV